MNLPTLHKISYGLYIVDSNKDGKYNGQIANTVFQATADPSTVAISINKNNLTHEYIETSKIFSISILGKETPSKFIGLFGFRCGRDLNKLENVNYKIGKTGAPIVLDNAIGYLECKVISSMDAGTHTLFLGKVLEAAMIDDHEPMTYAYYHQIKGGKSPKTAPTYISEEKMNKDEEAINMVKYKCTICGYFYDPAKGDPDSGIDLGTAFEKILDDWVCPVCGASKGQFEKVE